jgi:hypothetical protein
MQRNPRVLPSEKIRETVFIKSTGHSSTTFTFSHWANKLSFLIERHPGSKAKLKIGKFVMLRNDKIFL